MAAKLYGDRTRDLIAFSRRDAALPSVEVHDGIIHWIVRERGRELQHRTTADLDEALHWIALDATSASSIRWELEQRHRFPEGAG
ncbi:Imm63 family immunity protein [Streptomyces noursei]|uniref:Imm63 family immunity protein n=1 Tax=Streptomyces TaxID=1883 RepID=UPI002F26D988